MKTAHVRRPLKPAFTGAVLRDRACRFNGTYCGADPTDVDFGDKDKLTYGLINPCRECLETRDREYHDSLTYDQKREHYDRGAFLFPAPPVPTFNWSKSDWIAFIDRFGRWQRPVK
jgi:hypothetical protein